MKFDYFKMGWLDDITELFEIQNAMGKLSVGSTCMYCMLDFLVLMLPAIKMRILVENLMVLRPFHRIWKIQTGRFNGRILVRNLFSFS
jgi:hypothetical protein